MVGVRIVGDALCFVERDRCLCMAPFDLAGGRTLTTFVEVMLIPHTKKRAEAKYYRLLTVCRYPSMALMSSPVRTQGFHLSGFTDEGGSITVAGRAVQNVVNDELLEPLVKSVLDRDEDVDRLRLLLFEDAEPYKIVSAKEAVVLPEGVSIMPLVSKIFNDVSQVEEATPQLWADVVQRLHRAVTEPVSDDRKVECPGLDGSACLDPSIGHTDEFMAMCDWL